MATGIGILLCDDLIFSSRITGTAQHFGGRMRLARSLPAALQLAQVDGAESAPATVIVDLHLAGLDIAELVREFRTRFATPVTIIGYGSHVAVDVLKAARQAGCDRVMPRSQFVEQLPVAMPEWLGLSESSAPADSASPKSS
ncbi:response regulator [Tuwongella immobilis]|uniref:Response regulatory domain-containing protein n=1 Tax=Tuwongella immobilis TaxID=692036 RepID=A0A6C2YN85_9BACT|nr:hypothetical protein [Tuwongella immobilis]VIP02837.1 Uncharacterized protein OS=Planctomyces brasiliensis (strain ATCC 49424 / DSM 5305 / JCM 21570 / NBRC 103401 / IFAM 1448) GN=Plabr_0475 PE=4 SV=1: Response_reg [Tuwongella immobilis]VTS02599.1 Uncharacterized protein OS=Planctomyces brasiliensis (strain ATCC 49424 / DSM 5305 / JCM 21570 / NBRC 103401 / IFAM 1448) GN=Plabr_0475 PE=4 SV=1: Response_reg [Tuwongella immobilis]